MPNIMLTYRCNLKCPYCFANEFVNKNKTDISIENFETAVNFLTKNGKTSIGLIGGEPTLHPDFKEIIKKLLANRKIEEVTVYTNGILLGEYIYELVHPKVRILVNCNSPTEIGESNYKKIVDNLDTLFNKYYMKDRINLGINLYSDNLNYQYMIELLKRYQLHRVRISITVPDFSTVGDVDVIDYFKQRKPFLLEFFKNMDSIQVLPYYDCNKPPFCIWNEEERSWIENYVSKYPVSECNLIGRKSTCWPVIDILPDLKAVRCFGMSDFLKLNIADFEDITDLASYFLNEIDANIYNICKSEMCVNCYERKVRHCVSGCLGFKSHKINQINNYISNL